MYFYLSRWNKVKGKPTPVTDSYCCETSKLPHFLENWIIDGRKTDTFRACKPLSPGYSRYLFPLETEFNLGLEVLGQLKTVTLSWI
jgi:hypothetical protein